MGRAERLSTAALPRVVVAKTVLGAEELVGLSAHQIEVDADTGIRGSAGGLLRLISGAASRTAMASVPGGEIAAVLFTSTA
ncbi:hypothetical protein [Allosalinactinospora lopnorensis]|uniref:hypothetical protein n=1 Tax=Allosalinactinospora lopnorensis TaxID=1352348 RepID=UPI000623D363|nr:hypothetical protein [Allosalinactinospora lopnorensis]